MIYLRSISQIKCEEFDEVWLIIRSTGKATGMLKHNNVKHKPNLSPSKELFYAYLNWKKQGTWNASCFEQKYAPQFIQEAQTNPYFVKDMVELKNLDIVRKKIALVCFCGDETLCHRSIVGALCMINNISVEKPDVVSKYVERYFPR